MAGDRSEMVAIIYPGRTGESARAPTQKVSGVIAREAWDLHKAVVDADEVHVGQAGFRRP